MDGRILLQPFNTLITITNREGDAISWGSSGSSGFKGTRKSTPYAATIAVENAVRKPPKA